MNKIRFLHCILICAICSSLAHSQNNNATHAQDSLGIPQKISSVFTYDEIAKSDFYISLWGERYREAYATPVAAPILNLTTFIGGLSIINTQESDVNNIILKDVRGEQYRLRALHKNPTAYLSNETLKEEYNEGSLDDTYTANFIDDMGTGAHPFISLAVGSLARDLQISHTSPQLFYVPRDERLGAHVHTIGGALYYLEKRIPNDATINAEILNTKNALTASPLIETSQLLELLKEDHKNKIDQPAYIRARIFDMHIGDWNRGLSQWDWYPNTSGIDTIYTPIAKNSDQAFSKMGDGPLMRLTTYFSGSRRHLANYDGELTNAQWLNSSAFALDKSLLTNLDEAYWLNETNNIVANLTDAVIDKAFSQIPDELDDRISRDIIFHLKQRKTMLPQLVRGYVALLNKLIVVKGTQAQDIISLERLTGGQTHIVAKSTQDGSVFYDEIVNSKDARAVWVYGLAGDDVFKVYGNAKGRYVPVTIFGGADRDTFDIQNKKKVTSYDFLNEPITLKSQRVKVKTIDEREAGVYNYKRLKRYANTVRPLIGVNVDDGLILGAENTFTDYGFQHTPFSQQQTLSAAFYFATSGFDLQYENEFIHAIGKLNVGLEAQVTSPNYTRNFFGFGNETINLNDAAPDAFELDYNRVRVQKVSIAPSISYKDMSGYSLKATAGYASIAIENTDGRFIEEYYALNNNPTSNNFVSITGTASYDDSAQNNIPYLDVNAKVALGSTYNITQKNNVVHAQPQVAITLPFTQSIQLWTNLSSYVNFNNDITFYQGAMLGADNGLRGYRNQRFTGIHSFVQSSDLRVKLNRIKTKLIPLDLGLFGGFDYGRVWTANDDSNDWKTSIGGGLFFDTTGLFVGKIAAFHSEEGLRVSLRLGVSLD